MPSGHLPSVTSSTPNIPHTSKSAPLMVTNAPTVLAKLIASSKVADVFKGSPSLLIIVYMRLLYTLFVYLSSGALTKNRT